MFGEFNEAGKLKTALAKYSIKFNNFAESQRSHGRIILGAVRQAFHITACDKVCGQISLSGKV